ncbi:hypothetical protein [Thiocystis violascens]|nr:hypothetical protein [Thiocystis violascens]
MLDLESPRWSQLSHAYGSAADIPAMLRALTTLPTSEGRNEPWFSLWSALAHQGDVFEGSYAAVPHVVAALAIAPDRADASYFHFPAWVEICRERNGPSIPKDLEAPYFEALRRLPALVAAAVHASWSPEHLGCCMAALAVAKGQPAMAEAALELTPALAERYLAWVSEQ